MNNSPLNELFKYLAAGFFVSVIVQLYIESNRRSLYSNIIEKYEQYALVSTCEQEHCPPDDEGVKHFLDENPQKFCEYIYKQEQCGCKKCSWGPTQACADLLNRPKPDFMAECEQVLGNKM